MKKIPYTKQSINSNDLQAVANALQEEIITRGAYVKQLEEKIGQYCGAQYAVAFNSGTSALQAACFAADINPYDRLFTTPNSFIATAAPALLSKANLIFIDINLQSGNVDLDLLEPSLEKRYSRGKNLILPVHFSGIAVDMQKIQQMVRNPDSVIIEDAAHALGSTYPQSEVKVGSCAWSDMTVFSFHPAKIMTTGEGGMVTTNNENYFHRLQLFRNNGIEREQQFLKNGKEAIDYYEVHRATGNYNFTDFQAALGLSQLNRLDTAIQRRKDLIRKYRQILTNETGIALFDPKFDQNTAYTLMVVQIDFDYFKKKRSEVIQTLQENGIGTQVHYIPLYRHPILNVPNQDLGPFFPQMEKYYSRALSLPLYTDLSLEEVEFVVDKLKEILLASPL